MKNFWEMNSTELAKFAQTRVDKFIKNCELGSLSCNGSKKLSVQLVSDFKYSAKGLRRISNIEKSHSLKKRVFQLFCNVQYQRCMLVLAMNQKPNRIAEAGIVLSDIDVIVSRLCQVTKQNESFITYAKQKSSGKGSRPISEFGLVRYVQQTGLKYIMLTQEPKNVLSANIHKPSSTHQAARILGEAFKDGYKYVITVDILNSFSSIKKRHVRYFGILDDRLTRYVAFPTHTGEQKASPQSMLPQGGAHSSSIQSFLIDIILGGMPEMKEIVIVYADNFAICSETRDGVISAFVALQRRMEKHPAGSLFLHDLVLSHCHIHGLDGKFYNPKTGKKDLQSPEFCGYRVSYHFLSNEVRYRPSKASFKKFWKRVVGENYNGDLPVWTQDKTNDELGDIAMKHLESWHRSFPLWGIKFDEVKKLYDKEFPSNATKSKLPPIEQRSEGVWTWFSYNLDKQINLFQENYVKPLAA